MRARPSRHVVALRAAAAVPACLVGAILVAARPVPAVAVAAGLAAVAAAAGAVAPRWPWPTAALVLLAVAYAVASQPAGAPVRVAASVGMAAVLWGLHVVYAAAAEVPRRAAIERAAVLRWRHRLLSTVAVAAPVTAVAGVAGAVAPSAPWMRAVGLIAAAAIAAAPGLLAFRSSRAVRGPAGGQAEAGARPDPSAMV